MLTINYWDFTTKPDCFNNLKHVHQRDGRAELGQMDRRIDKRTAFTSGGCPNNERIKIIIIIASHEDEMNDTYNDKLCTSNEVISEMSEEI